MLAIATLRIALHMFGLHIFIYFNIFAFFVAPARLVLSECWGLFSKAQVYEKMKHQPQGNAKFR